MAKRILVPIDRSAQAQRACEFVLEEYAELAEIELVLLHVINPADAGYSTQASVPGFSEEWYEERKREANGLFDDIESTAAGHGLTVDRAIEVGKPIHTIVEYVEENDIDQIVMGSHGRSGVSRILLGSVAETVVRRSPVPVTVVR